GSATVLTHTPAALLQTHSNVIRSSYRRVATGPWQIAERDATARLSGHAPTSSQMSDKLPSLSQSPHCARPKAHDKLGSLSDIEKAAQLDTLFQAQLCCQSTQKRTAPTGSCMLDEYRQRFRDFHTQWQREQYLFLAGRKEVDERPKLYSEHSDLF